MLYHSRDDDSSGTPRPTAATTSHRPAPGTYRSLAGTPDPEHAAARHRPGPDPDTRQAVKTRDKRQCACCGVQVTRLPHSIGYRKPPSQGGDTSMPNLLLFLGRGRDPSDPNDHRARVESRRNPDDGIRGLFLRPDQDPAQVPVEITTASGRSRLWLLPDGTRTPERPAPETS